MHSPPPPDLPADLSGRLNGSGNGEQPVHIQVQRLLRVAIDQHFEDGQIFWPELLLMERLGVSRNTVRQALGALTREGLLQQHSRNRIVSKSVTGVGIFLQLYDSDFRADLLHHIARICHGEWGIDLRIFYTVNLERTLESFLNLSISEHKIRLLLFDGAKNNMTLHRALGGRYRTAMLDTQPAGYEGAFVGTDAAEAVRTGVMHLLHLGHRRITLLVNEPVDEETVQVKVAAFRELVERYALQGARVHLGEGGQEQHAFDVAYGAMEALWAQAERPTAIFTLSDPGAFGVLKWLGERHVRVPNEVSVLGFEGARSSRYTQPALSTVAHPIEEIARRAVGMLFDEKPGPELLRPVLVVRDSTGRAGR